MSTEGWNFISNASNPMLDCEGNDYCDQSGDILGQTDVSFTSSYTERDDCLFGPDDTSQLYESRPYYIPTNIKASATLCELISRLTNEELEAKAPRLPLLFANKPETGRKVWMEIYQEARKVLQRTRVSFQLPPFHIMFPCLFPNPLTHPEVLELWIHIIILLHYSIIHEAWFNVLTLDSDEEVDFSEQNIHLEQHTGQTDMSPTTSVARFIQWLHMDGGCLHSWNSADEHSISVQHLKNKQGTAPVGFSSFGNLGLSPSKTASMSQLLKLQDAQFQSCHQQLIHKIKHKTKAGSFEDHHECDQGSPCLSGTCPDVSSYGLDTESGNMGHMLPPFEDRSSLLGAQSICRDGLRQMHADRDEKSNDLYFRVFFSGSYGAKYLKPINRGDLRILEDKYFKSLVIDGSILLLVLKSRAALTLGFSFLMTHKLQRLALSINWDREVLLPNAEILLSSTSSEVDLDLPDLTLIRQTQPIHANKSSLNENSVLSDNISEIAGFDPHERDAWPNNTSLATRIFNSKLTSTIQDVVESGFYEFLLKLVDLDLSAVRPISLIPNMAKQGKSKTDITVLRSVCQTVTIPKLVCSTDLSILEKNVLPVANHIDIDTTLALHLLRLIETLRAPLSFEIAANPKTVEYHYIMERFTIQTIPGQYLICQYLCKGQWRISISAPGRSLTITPRHFGLYDYVYIRPDFTAAVNNPFLPIFSRDYSKDLEWHRIIIIPMIRSAMLHCAATPSALSTVVRALSNLPQHRSILKYLLIENLFDPVLRTAEPSPISTTDTLTQKTQAPADKPSGLRMINVKSVKNIAEKGNTARGNDKLNEDRHCDRQHDKQHDRPPLPPSPTIFHSSLGAVSPQHMVSPRILMQETVDAHKEQPKQHENDTLETPYYINRRKHWQTQRIDTATDQTVISIISRTVPSWKTGTVWHNPPTIVSQEIELISTMESIKKSGICPVICFDLMLPLSTSMVTDLPERYAECMRKCDRVVKAGLTSLRVSLPQSTISYYSCLKKTSAIRTMGSTDSLPVQQNVAMPAKFLMTSMYDCTTIPQSATTATTISTTSTVTSTVATATAPASTSLTATTASDKITRLLLDYTNDKTWSLLIDELAMTHYKYRFTGVVLRGIDYPHFLSQPLPPPVKLALLRKLAIDIWSRIPSLILFAFAADAAHACLLMKAGIIPIMREYNKYDLSELDQFSMHGVSEHVGLTVDTLQRSFTHSGSTFKSKSSQTSSNTSQASRKNMGRIVPFLKESFSFYSICSMFLHRPFSLFTIDDINIKSGISVHRTIKSIRQTSNKIAFSTMLHNATVGPDLTFTKDFSKQQKPSLYTQMDYPAILDLLAQNVTSEFVRHVCISDVNQTCNSGLCYGLYRDSPQSLTIVVSNVGRTRQALIDIPDICKLLKCDSTTFLQLTYKSPGAVRMSIAYNAIYDDPIPNFSRCKQMNKLNGSKDRGRIGITPNAIEGNKTALSEPYSNSKSDDPPHSYKSYTSSHIDLADVTMEDLRKSSYLNGSYDYSISKFQKIKMLSDQWNGAVLAAGSVAYGGFVVTAPYCCIFSIRLHLVPDDVLRLSRPIKHMESYQDSETFARSVLNRFMSSTVFMNKQSTLNMGPLFRSQPTSQIYSAQQLELYVRNVCCRVTDMILCINETDMIQKIHFVIYAIAHSPFSTLLIAAAHRLIYSESSENSAATSTAASRQGQRRGLRSSLLMKSPLGKELAEARHTSAISQLTVMKSIDMMDLMRIVPRYILELIAGSLETPQRNIWTIPMSMLVESARSILSVLYPHVKKSIKCANNRDSSGLLKSTCVPDVIIVASRLNNFLVAKALLLAESGYSVSLFAPLYETPQGQESVPTHILGPIPYTGETYRNDYLCHNFGIHHMWRRFLVGTTLEVTLLHSFEFFYDSYHNANIELNERNKCVSEMIINEQTNEIYPYYKRSDQIACDGSCGDLKASQDAMSNSSSIVIPFIEGVDGQKYVELSLIRAKVLADFVKQKYGLSDNHNVATPRMIISTPGIGANAAMSLATSFGLQQVRSLKLTEGAHEHSGYDIDESCGLTSEYTFVTRPKMVLLMNPNVRSLSEFMYDLLGVKFTDYGKIFDLIKQLGISDTGILDPFHPYFLYNVRAAVLEADIICGDFDVINLLKMTPWINWALSNREIIVDDDDTGLLIKYVQLLMEYIERGTT